jgi:hypothetical protein
MNLLFSSINDQIYFKIFYDKFKIYNEILIFLSDELE